MVESNPAVCPICRATKADGDPLCGRCGCAVSACLQDLDADRAGAMRASLQQLGIDPAAVRSSSLFRRWTIDSLDVIEVIMMLEERLSEQEARWR
jgi:hypothetical protein